MNNHSAAAVATTSANLTLPAHQSWAKHASSSEAIPEQDGRVTVGQVSRDRPCGALHEFTE
jgi:hypothetical protein